MSRNASQLLNNGDSVVTLPSAVGFNAGDLVYFNNNVAVPPPISGATVAPFSVYQDQAATPLLGSQVVSAPNAGGGSRFQGSAKLTNGNLVFVYSKKGTYNPSFTITDQNGLTVVAETSISSTYRCTGCSITVAALSGGGFVVSWINDIGGTTYAYNHAIYSNTGSVVLAAVNDGTLVTSNLSSWLVTTALPNGGFVSAMTSTSPATTAKFRIFDATGTAVNAWTSFGSANYQYTTPISIAARSDSSFLVFTAFNSTVFNYAVYTSTGSTSVGFTTITPTIGSSGTSTRALDCTVLSDGLTVVVAYNGFNSSSPFVCMRTISSSNVVSSEVYVPLANVNPGYPKVASTIPIFGIFVKGVSANRFVLTFSDQAGCLNYMVYNSSLVSLYGSYSNPITSAALSQYCATTVVETASSFNIYWTYGLNTDNTNNYQLVKISPTTYEIQNNGTMTSTTVASVTTGVGTSTLANSTPTGIRFPASSSVVLSTQSSMSALVTPKTLLSTACDQISSATMANGKTVVVYRTASTFTMYASIVSREGAIETTISLGISDTTALETTQYMGVAVLTGGTIVIAYPSPASKITLASYDSNLSFITSTTITSAVIGNDWNYSFQMCAITNDRFVVSYRSSSGYYLLSMYSSALAQLVAPWAPLGADSGSSALAANINGGFTWVTWYGGAGTQYIFSYSNDSGNTLVLEQQSTFGNNLASRNRQITVSPAGVVTAGTSPTTSFIPYNLSNRLGLVATGATESITLSTSTFQQLGMTGNGSSLFLWNNTNGVTSSTFIYGFPAGVLQQNTWSTYCPSLTVSHSVYSSTGGPHFWIQPNLGYSASIVYFDNSRYPTFMMVNAYPYQQSELVTGGTTLSNIVSINPNPQGYLPNYVLQGVAVTSAPAGGTGQVQTKGLAQLNSSYSAGTSAQAFDYQQPNGTGVDGVKGTIVGRTVNLQGTK